MARLYPNLNEPWSDVDEEDPHGHEDHSMQFYNRGRETHRERSSYHNYSNMSSGRDFTDTVSLTEFEDHFLKRRQTPGQNDPEPRREHSDNSETTSRVKSSGASSNIVSCSRDIALRGLQWVVGASLWKKALLGSGLGLLCAVLLSTLRLQMESPSKDNYLQCPLPVDGRFPPCITDAELRSAKLIVSKMAEILHNRAAQYICSGDVPNLALSVEELRELLPVPREVSPSDMKNVFYLILYNPHWNIRWMDKDNKTVTDWTHYPLSTDQLVSTSPSLSLRCRLLLLVATIWQSIQWALIVLLFGIVLYVIVALYFKKRRTEQSAVYALVTRIMDVMKFHNKKCSTKKELLPYLAITHVRDMLIPPSERKSKQQLWEKAVHWIASHESRVRVETRRIAGEDFEVWRWIQEDPPPTEISVPPPASTTSRSQCDWHGSVFDHYPPEITTKVAPPTGTPSLCIRLKNMFEPVRRMEQSQCHELENAVLERCRSHGAVVHVWVDKKSPFGCVYLKMDSLKSAMGAYNALHGGWYKGKLVTAKYISEAKYHKWFPISANAKHPILPS